AADVPATVFLATGYIGRLEGFWWDEIANLVLLGTGLEKFELSIRGVSVEFDLGDEPPAREDGTTPVTALAKRRAALWTFREALRPLNDEERRRIIGKARSLFAGCPNSSLGRPMTFEEARALAKDGLVTIGAHTVTHPVLTGLDATACYRE